MGSRVSLMRQGHLLKRELWTLIRPNRIWSARWREHSVSRRRRGDRNSINPINPIIASGASVLAVRDLNAGRDCHGVSLEVCAGEIVGLYGLPGCGRETIVRSLLGLAKIRSGSIEHRRSPTAA